MQQKSNPTKFGGCAADGFQVLAANGLHCPSSKPGSSFTDRTDMCDGNECAISCATAAPETPK